MKARRMRAECRTNDVEKRWRDPPCTIDAR
jgi:hypothetical protein